MTASARYAAVALVLALLGAPVVGAAAGTDGTGPTPPATGGTGSDAALAADRVDDSAVAANETVLHYEGEKIRVANAANQTIRGETDREPGTALIVRITSEDDRSPFLRTVETIVADDGTFAATVDMSAISPGANFTVAVLDGREEIASAPGTVECEADCPGQDGTPTPADASPTATPGATPTPADGSPTASPDAGPSPADGNPTGTPSAIGANGEAPAAGANDGPITPLVVLAAGGLLGIVGVGLFLGLFRS